MTFPEIQHALQHKVVGIAGCGGLGSNCAAMLVRSGIHRLVIVDFDKVENSNLNRQFFFKHQIGLYKAEALRDNLLLIQPEARIESHVLRIDVSEAKRLFSGCDVVVEAFDQAESKQMLIETMLEAFPDKKVVCASGLAGLHHADSMKVLRHGNLIAVGDFMESVSDENPPMAPKVNIAAALQANEVLKCLLLEADAKQ